MISKIIDEDLIQDAKRSIEEANDIVIVSHHSPDGDSLGSSLGWRHFLEFLEKKVTVVVPNNYPAYFEWLPGAQDILVYSDDGQKALIEEKIKNADLIFALDFNALSRIGDLGLHIADAAGKKIMVDHHLEPGSFADITISYPKMTSTCEMIFRLICRMGYFPDMTAKIGECLMVGLITDTGGFSYNSNDPELYTIVSELIRKGVDKDEVNRRINSYHNESRYRLLGFMLYKRMKLYQNLGVALTWVNYSEMKNFRYAAGDSEGIVNYPLQISGIVFSVFIKEATEGKLRFSFRSQGDVPVNEFATKYFNGGGHKNAAGGNFTGTIQEAITYFESCITNISETLNAEVSRQKEILEHLKKA